VAQRTPQRDPAAEGASEEVDLAIADIRSDVVGECFPAEGDGHVPGVFVALEFER
jgi:hypothetical protein